MSKLILKSPYIKAGGNPSGYMSYTAKRDGVEILPRSEGYLHYMATRPGADRHGLFGDAESVNLKSAMAEMAQHRGHVWTHIISLRREDAARLGYDNAQSWRNLLKTHRNDIAAAMKILPQDFRWYAAFHNEGEHPHVHMMAWSVKENDGFLTPNGIANIRSKLTNSVFRHELMHLYQQKSISRDALVQQAREAIKGRAQQLSLNPIDEQNINQLMLQLAQRLQKLSGKKQYGYLPKGTKKLVDQIVDELARQPSVQDCYDIWQKYKNQVDNYYSDAEPETMPLSQRKEFRAIKNAVVSAAVSLMNIAANHQPEPTLLPCATHLLLTLGKLFEDNAPQSHDHRHSFADRKLLRKMQQKKLAHGQRDEHTHTM